MKPDAFYSDVIERTYYNGLFAAMSPNGRHLCYSLSVEGTRSYWPSDTYCCPGNLRRAFAYLPSYFYTLTESEVIVNLYGESEARLNRGAGHTLTLVQTTDYPASGKIRFHVNPSRPLTQRLSFRIPAWCRKPVVLLNSKPISETPKPGTFLSIDKEWVAGDRVDLEFPMEWRWISGIRTKKGKAALARGPILYSLDPLATGLDYTDPSKKVNFVEEDAVHQAAYARLEEITLEPTSVAAPRLTETGFTTTVQGWSGKPDPSQSKTFVFRSFDQPEGRKIYFKLAPNQVAVKDELFGAALHEDTVYPARWEKIKSVLDDEKVRAFPAGHMRDALKVDPLFGAHESETAEGEIAGHHAWMSAVSPPESKRRMAFRVSDPRFTKSACANLTVTVVYLDLGDACVSLNYDSVDATRSKPKSTNGTPKTAGRISIGHSSEIRSQIFHLEGARFDKGVPPENADFCLTSDKPADFVIFGVYLQKAATPEKGSAKDSTKTHP
jgi:hypothetical protein